jgi:uncharacterized protein YbjT (DUF2867 family)
MACRWHGNNGPRQTDLESTRNFIAAAPKNLKHIAMCTSCGVERQQTFPFLILNTFGVLTFKKAGEEMVQESGVPYTIVRPARLSDGPYTGSGINDVILKATTGTKQGVALSRRDDQLGVAGRGMVAELLVQSFLVDELKNEVLSLESVEGDGPGEDSKKWIELIKRA